MSDNYLQPIQYKVTPSGMKFHNSTKKLKAMCGPFGSGKSVMCAVELLYNAMRQPPGSDGVRYSRYAVVRRHYPDLKTTTRRTLMMAYPRACGTIKESVPMEGTYRFTFRDADTGELIKVNMELILIAVDSSEESLEKLRSMDLTGAWINEATEASYDVVTTLNERVGRFPAGEMGTAREPIILMDYNMPPYGHWLLSLKKDHPDFMEFFEQPPAAFYHGEGEDGLPIFEVNPNAENLEVLNAGGKSYYQDQVDLHYARGRYSLIKQMLCLIPGVDESGKPVYEENYDPAEHTIKSRKPHEGEVVIGIDTSGNNPAGVIAQEFAGEWVVLDTVKGTGGGFEQFRDEYLLPLLRQKYPNQPVIAVCDPANAKDAWTGVTPVERLLEVGITAFVAPTNSVTTRIEVSRAMLNKRKGGIKVTESCEELVAALSGGYKFRKVGNNAGVELYSTTPIKDNFSHFADAFQYLCLYISGGEGHSEEQDIAEIFNQFASKKRYY